MNELNHSYAKNIESSTSNQEQMWAVKNVYPIVLVVGVCASGKSSVIGAVIAAGAKDPAVDIRVSSFLEFSLSVVDSDTVQQFQYKVPQSDAVWAIVNAGNPQSKAEIDILVPLLKNAREKLVIMTHVDGMSEVDKKLVEEFVRGHCSEHGVELHDNQVCTYYPSGDCKDLVARYSGLYDSKVQLLKDEFEECEKFSKNDILDFDIRRYRDSITSSCIPHDDEPQDFRASVTPTSSLTGAISGYVLVERILNYYGEKGVAKLLECTDSKETEFLELKTSYLLSEKDKKDGERKENLNWDIALALIAIANTAGGALIIGVGKDNRTLCPVEVKEDKEAFLRMKICQVLLPDQRVWTVYKKNGKDKNGKHVYVNERWMADELPRFEARLYPYSDGEKSGDVVLILVKPQPRGRYITLENGNLGIKLLVQREKGMGKVVSNYDSANFRTLDNERDIECDRYLTLLRKLVPDLNATPIGRSSGVYRFKPANGHGGKDIEDPLVRQTEGHRLCCDFKPGDQIGKYVVEERIGSGGMGVVYRVKQVSLGGEYALKAFKMESEDSSMAKERFRTEAKVLKQLDHPGLPKVHDLSFDQETECLYLVQDLIVGEDGKPHELGRYVVDPEVADAHGLIRISGETALKWLHQVCEIADYLHGKGIAHRDITLKNLLVNNTGDLKLTDFGVAKVMAPELRRIIDCQVTMTVTRTPSGDKGFWGTWRYLPPEVRNKRKEDIKPEATDVWAIGVCFFKLLTGEWFEGQQFEDYEWNKGKWGILLRGMLKSDSKERLSCANVLGVLAQKDSESGDKAVSKTRYDKLVAAFRKAVVPNSEGILPIIAMLDSPLLNIESPTLGGKLWWDTLCDVEGWRLQKNKFFNQIRILDSQNFRRAWGWRRGMERMLGCLDRPSNRHGKLVWWVMGGLMAAVLIAVACYIFAT